MIKLTYQVKPGGSSPRAAVVLLPLRCGVAATLLASAAVGVIVALARGPLPG